MIRTEDEVREILKARREKLKHKLLILVHNSIDDKESDLDKQLNKLGYDY